MSKKKTQKIKVTFNKKESKIIDTGITPEEYNNMNQHSKTDLEIYLIFDYIKITIIKNK